MIDTDTLEYNAVSPVDDNGREWPAYTSGGFAQWFAPMDLTGKSASMVIYDKKGGALEFIVEDTTAKNQDGVLVTDGKATVMKK